MEFLERRIRVHSVSRPTTGTMTRSKGPTIRRPWERRFHPISIRRLPHLRFLRVSAQGSQVCLVSGTMERPYPRVNDDMNVKVSEGVNGAARQTRVVRAARVIVIFIYRRCTICLLGEEDARRLFPRIEAAVCRCRHVVHVRRK